MEVFRKRGLEPNLETFIHQVKHFARVNDFSSALLVCSEMMKSSFFSLHPTSVYNTIIYVHGRAGDVEACEQVIKKMEKEGIQWDEETYGEIMKVYMRNGNNAKAREILKVMEDKGLIIDSALHSSLLLSYARANDMSACEDLMEEMKELGLAPNLLSYLDLIDKCCASQDVEMAVRMLNEMKERDMRPPGKVYEALVELCWNKGDSSSLSQVLSHMKEGLIFADIVYLGLMDKYDNDGRFKKSLALGEDLLARKEDVREPFYSKMISLYERNGNLDKCAELFREAIQKRFHPWIYPSLFISFHRMGNVDVCLDLLDAMRVRGSVDGQLYEKMMELQIRSGRIGDATAFVNTMGGLALKPSPTSYHFLIQAWSGTNRSDICTQLFNKMRDQGLVPLPNTYDIMLMTYGRKRDMVKCKQLWVEATKVIEEKEIGPIYNAMISVYGMVGDLRGAVGVWKEASSKGITLIESVYVALINVYNKKGDLKGIAELFEEVVKKGIPHGDKLYTSLFVAFTAHGRVEKGPVSLVSLLTAHNKSQELTKVLADVKRLRIT